MSEGFSAFKAMAFGIGGLLVATSVAPQMSGGHFDPLRLAKRDVMESSTMTRKGSATGGGSGKVRYPKPRDVVDPTPTPTEPTPTEPTPTPSPTPTYDGAYPELSMIPSNFDVSSELRDVALQQPVTNDVVGAFRFVCNAGQIRYDDPIVYPNQPGRSHLHQFFGNTEANASSTYESLRTTGQSTCMNPTNRSAYWMPAMLNGRGQVVRPDYITIYYKRFPATSSYCSTMATACLPLANGLRFIFGYNMSDPAAGNSNSHYFNCDGPGGIPGRYPDIVTAAKNCPTGARIGAAIVAPECWDGKNLDSADHRSHLAYPSYGNWGYLKCPSTHQYIIPHFSMVAWYTVDDTLDRSGTWEAGKTQTWSLSSDSMPGMTPQRPGTTLHADWFGAWDNQIMAMWTQNCIDRKLSCSSGDLGNGKGMKMFSGFSWNASPRLVSLPQ